MPNGSLRAIKLPNCPEQITNSLSNLIPSSNAIQGSYNKIGKLIPARPVVTNYPLRMTPMAGNAGLIKTSSKNRAMRRGRKKSSPPRGGARREGPPPAVQCAALRNKTPGPLAPSSVNARPDWLFHVLARCNKYYRPQLLVIINNN